MKIKIHYIDSELYYEECTSITIIDVVKIEIINVITDFDKMKDIFWLDKDGRKHKKTVPINCYIEIE